MIAQPSLFDVPKWFDGKTYSPKKDGKRLGGQFDAVCKFMLAHANQPVTIAMLRDHGIRGTETGLTARIRDMRKPRFGGYDVRSERLDGGLYAYRLVL